MLNKNPKICNSYSSLLPTIRNIKFPGVGAKHMFLRGDKAIDVRESFMTRNQYKNE